MILFYFQAHPRGTVYWTDEGSKWGENSPRVGRCHENRRRFVENSLGWGIYGIFVWQNWEFLPHNF